MDKLPLETNAEESQIRFRDCFSVRYIQSAAVLCRLAYGIEKEYSGSGGSGIPDPELLLRHEAFVLNSVLSSVVFLESTINELYADASDDAYFFADAEHEALLHAISEGWRNEKNFDRSPTVNKYQKILEIVGMPPFDEGDPAFANVRQLIEIRNHLMHYKREWVVLHETRSLCGSEGSTSEKFEKILRKKFAVNPFSVGNPLFFPDQCLGHGCAEWAVVNSIIFTDAFFRRLGLPAPYEGIRDELATR